MVIQAKPGEWLFIQKQRITDETLIVGTTQYVDRLGESEFLNCTFDIVKPSAVMIERCRLINCVFRPRKPVADRPIGDNYWEKCVFHGHYEGSNFGLSSDDIDGPSGWPDVALRGCDFSRAILAGCAFQRLDIASTEFPLWPCFTVLHPFKNWNAWRAWREKDLPVMPLYKYETSSEGIVAESYHWPSLVKWYKITSPPDPEVVKTALQKLDFVRV